MSDSAKVSVKCVVIGPRITRRMWLVALAVVLAVVLLSAYMRSLPSDGELFCIKLNQRTASDLIWDGDGCVIKLPKRAKG